MAFRPVDLSRALDWQAFVAGARAEVSIKGMFFEDTVQLLKDAGRPVSKKYIAFKDYPQQEFLELTRDAAIAAMPSLGARAALYQMALNVYPRLATSLIGRVVFAAVGKDPQRVLGLVSKAYSVAVTGCEVQLLSLEQGRAVVRYKNAPLPLEGSQLGALHGAILEAGARPGPCLLDLQDEHSGVLDVRWEALGAR
jgi:uncharacterized protein (TIGR02265 family)